MPARGGSKRIPRKNIRPFVGLPVVSRVISTLQESRLFDDIVVTTEDGEIANVCSASGVSGLLRRPRDLSDDFVMPAEVVAHSLKEMGLTRETVCVVFPTAALMAASDLHQAAQIFSDGQWLYVLAATPYRYPVQRSFRRGDDNGIEMLQPEEFNSRSQDLPLTYHDVGWFYFAKCETWLTEPTIFSGRSTFVEIPPNRAIDIDTEEDWALAELMWKQIRGT